MVGDLEVLAVVQARGGSKGLPRKNLRLLGEFPLVAYSIISGLNAKTVTRLIVSTDDHEIADVSRYYGAEVPFIRPAELATDDAIDYSLFHHALEWLKTNQGYEPQVVVQLRPTAPLRPRGLIDESVRILIANPEADCVRSVTPSGQNPYKMWRVGPRNFLEPLLTSDQKEHFNMPRQKLPETYWHTGHVDAIASTTINEKRSLTGDWVCPVYVDSQYCVDIDTQLDLDLANWTLTRGLLDIDLPSDRSQGRNHGPIPDPIGLLVFDFDGVFTDNRVWLNEDGSEAVEFHRGDGLGLSQIKLLGIDIIVLASELNPVVTARCRKLNIECIHDLGDKSAALRAVVSEKQLDINNVVYVGNDVNDLGCMQMAGCAVAVADAHPSVLAKADIVLQTCGGHGAVREICDLVVKREEQKWNESVK